MEALCLLIVCALPNLISSSIIFDSPGSLNEPITDFEENECFKSSIEASNWFTKKTMSPVYSRYARPGGDAETDENRALQINVSIDMNSMASVDDINSEYKIILKIDLEWSDPRFRHDCSKRPVPVSINEFQLGKMWQPALGVPNIKDPDTSNIQGESTLILGQVRTDGYVHLRLSLLLNLFCYLDFQLFPFDSQECFIKLESRSYSKKDLILSWREDHPFRNHESFQISGFRLIDYELYNDSNIGESSLFKEIYNVAQGSGIMVKLVIKREWTNYFLEIYLPSVLFVMISWLSFWMNINSAPARVSLGMTTMLTLVTSSRATRDKLPRVSYIQALDIWIAFCICSIFLSLAEFAVVSYIYRRALNRNKQMEAQEARRVSARRGSSSTRCNSEVFSIENMSNTSRDQLHLNKSCGCEVRRSSQPDTMSRLLDLMMTFNERTECLELATKKNKTRLGGCLDCNGEGLADAIDRWSRLIFPSGFIIFNIGYWCHYHT